MSVYAVHAPPPKADNAALDPERFIFVRDGFHFWAFLFAPLWLLVKRLWLALVLYIVLIVALQVIVLLARVPPEAGPLVSLMLHLLIGLEAATVQRWTLSRRGWTQLDIVSGDDQESAERRFFDAWVAQPGNRPIATPPPSSPPQASIISDMSNLYPSSQPRTS